MDTKITGFGCVIFPSGVKSYFHVRKVQGVPRRRTLGAVGELSLEAARDKATELNGKLSKWKLNDFEGKSPLDRETDVRTFGGLFDEYLERHVKPKSKNPAKAQKYLGELMAHLSPLKSRQLASIQRDEVIALHGKISANGARVVANRVVAFVRTLFYFGEMMQIYKGKNPASRMGKVLNPEKSRERFITREEMPRFLAEVEAEKNVDLKDFLLLSLLTGARSGDVLSAKWAHFDLENAQLTIPNQKTGKQYTVALVPRAVQVFRDRARTSDVWVFPSHGATEHRNSPRDAWRKFLKRVGFSEHLTIHDVRRTHGSWQAELGSSLPIIGKSLGHSGTSATAIYSRLDLRPVRASVQTATDAMFASGKKLTVVPAPRRNRKSA